MGPVYFVLILEQFEIFCDIPKIDRKRDIASYVVDHTLHPDRPTN